MRRTRATSGTLCLAIILAMSLAFGCGTSPPETPPAASSVSPDLLSLDDLSPLEQQHLIEVFIKKGTGPEETKAMEEKIASMPEVEKYAYITEEQALEEFEKRLGDNADELLANLTTNPLPASFRILVREQSQVKTVAERFFDDAIVDNSEPGEHDGVQYSEPPALTTCPVCEGDVSSDAVFCPHCGHPLH